MTVSVRFLPERIPADEDLVEGYALQKYFADVVVPANSSHLHTISLAALRRRESFTPESESSDTPEIPYVVFFDSDPVCRDFVLWIEDCYCGWRNLVVERPTKRKVGKLCGWDSGSSVGMDLTDTK